MYRRGGGAIRAARRPECCNSGAIEKILRTTRGWLVLDIADGVYGKVHGEDGWEQLDRHFGWGAPHLPRADEPLETLIAEAAGVSVEEASRLADEALREWAERRETEEGRHYEAWARVGRIVTATAMAFSAVGVLAALVALALAARRLAQS